MDASEGGGKMTRGQREIALLQTQLREASEVSEHLRELLAEALVKPTSTVENLNMQLMAELQEKEAEMAILASTVEQERREWADRVAEHERQAGAAIERERLQSAERMAEQDRKVAETIQRERRQYAEKMEEHERMVATAIEKERDQFAERTVEHERETAEAMEENRKEFEKALAAEKQRADAAEILLRQANEALHQLASDERKTLKEMAERSNEMEKALAAEKERGDTAETQLRRANETISHLAKKLRESEKQVTSFRKRLSSHGIKPKPSLPSSCKIHSPPGGSQPSPHHPCPMPMLPMHPGRSSSSQMCFCANPPPPPMLPPYAAPRLLMPPVDFNSPSFFFKLPRRSQSGRRSTGRDEFSPGWMWAPNGATIHNATPPATVAPNAETMKLEEGEKNGAGARKEPDTALDSNWVSWRQAPPCC